MRVQALVRVCVCLCVCVCVCVLLCVPGNYSTADVSVLARA